MEVTLEHVARACHMNKIAVDILTGYDAHQIFQYGIRLRPWANKPGKGTMILATGPDLVSAGRVAVAKARADRWEALDYAKRPWDTAPVGGGDTWGLDTPL